ADRAGCHFRKADAVAAPRDAAERTVVFSGLEDVIHVECPQVGGARERAGAAGGRDGSTLNINASEQQRIDVDEALCLVSGEAEVLAEAINHHVDAARTFETANVDGDAGIVGAVDGRDAGNATQDAFDAS